MLVLSRKLNEAIRIGGDISIRVVRIDRDCVRLGISAPTDIGVHREEIYVEIVESNIAAAESATPEQLSMRLRQLKAEATEQFQAKHKI